MTRGSGHGHGAVRVLAARWLVPRPETWVEDGGLLVRAGRVERVLSGSGAVRRAARAHGVRPVDAGRVVLAPGTVDAHAHLELSGLGGRLTGEDFVGWVGALLRARAARGPRGLERDARRGAARLLATGTTTVGDVDSTGAARRALAGGALRVRLYREVYDAGDAARRAQALRSVARALPRRTRLAEGLSPHAPHTVGAELGAAVARLAARRGIPIAVHWAESAEEVEWLARGGGPFRSVLGAGGGESGLLRLQAAGLLGPRTQLVHGNHPERGDAARVAAAGATLVHCPGTHAFFGRAPFDWRRWRRAGVVLALGTDSLASNADLDLRREMALARQAAPQLAPQDVWRMATLGGARAVGWEGEVGELSPGAWADCVAHEVRGDGRRAALEALTSGASVVRTVWIGGRVAFDGETGQVVSASAAGGPGPPADA